MSFSLVEAQMRFGGTLINGEGRCYQRFHTDSRHIKPGSVYVALSGQRFDGHDFAISAIQAGASAIVVERLMPVSVPQWLVSDTRLALGQLAALKRESFNGHVISLTGSAGKTTTKEFIRSLLAQQFTVLATPGNYNNEIGVPLTLSQLDGQEMAVIELGANHVGEIAYTASIAQAHVSLLTNASEAHLEGFGGLDQVRQAKGEIFSALAPGAIGVVNLDDAAADYWLALRPDIHYVTFSLQNAAADYYLEILNQTVDGSLIRVVGPRFDFKIDTGLSAKHYLVNMIAAIAVVDQFDLSVQNIKKAIARLSPVSGRGQISVNSIHDWVIFDDCYNANPASVRAAIDTLELYTRAKVLILGDFAELGDYSEQAHRDIGCYAQTRIDLLITVGELSKYSYQTFNGVKHHFESKEAFLEQMSAVLSDGSAICVKGSRSAGLEKIVEKLKL